MLSIADTDVTGVVLNRFETAVQTCSYARRRFVSYFAVGVTSRLPRSAGGRFTTNVFSSVDPEPSASRPSDDNDDDDERSRTQVARSNRAGVTLARPHVIQMTSARIRRLELHLGCPRRWRWRLWRFSMILWPGLRVRFWLYYGTTAFRRADHVEGAADLADPRLKS